MSKKYSIEFKLEIGIYNMFKKALLKINNYCF